LGQANSTGMPPDQKVSKALELTYLSTNIAFSLIFVILFAALTKKKSKFIKRLFLAPPIQ